MASIQHTGIITAITEKNIKVKIERSAACGSCSAKKMCGMNESKEMFVDVAQQPEYNLQIGDRVIVTSQSSAGWKAVFYGYLLPFIIFISLIGGMLFAQLSEGIAALSGIVGLIAYYFILYLFRDKISQKFSFRIEKE